MIRIVLSFGISDGRIGIKSITDFSRIPSMRRVSVASLSELPPGTMKTYEVEGEHILLANIEGRIYAMGAFCSHEEWDLSEGTLEGENVVCAGHGAVWNLKTGQAQFIRPLPPLPIYRVSVEDDTIFIYMK